MCQIKSVHIEIRGYGFDTLQETTQKSFQPEQHEKMLEVMRVDTGINAYAAIGTKTFAGTSWSKNTM